MSERIPIVNYAYETGPLTKGDERKLMRFKTKIQQNIHIMCYVSTDKQIPTRGEEIMNYRNYTTVQILWRLSGIND